MRRSSMANSGSIRRWTTRCVFAFAVVAIAAANASLSAGASAVTATDPAGDNAPAFDPRGDIVDVGLVYESSQLILSATTATFDDPMVSPNWTTYGSGVVFTLETTGDSTPDYYVSFFTSGFSPYAVVVSAGGTLVCGAEPGWNPAARMYVVTVEPACVGNPAGVAQSSSFQYMTPGAASFDDTSFTDVASPTTTTTTTSTTTSTTTTTTAPPPTTTTTTTVEVTTTTTPPPDTTTTTMADDCKPGNGWGDTNHVHCPRELKAAKKQR
jgi:hypothetical protein